MTAQRIEFVGGPLDGQHTTIDIDRLAEWRVPVPTNPRSWLTQLHVDEEATYRVGVYKPVTEADELLGRWHWHEPKGTH
jgi:hypothetical protein